MTLAFELSKIPIPGACELDVAAKAQGMDGQKLGTRETVGVQELEKITVYLRMLVTLPLKRSYRRREPSWQAAARAVSSKLHGRHGIAI